MRKKIERRLSEYFCPLNPVAAEQIILNALAGRIGTERVSRAAA
jgi:hypothetical protein